MKIINQLTLRYLKENKKRSILTILCIMVSVIMISCVGIAFYSGQQFYKNYIEKTTGDYHYKFVSNNQEFLDVIRKDKDIKKYYFSSTHPYYGDNELNNKSFLNMKRGDSLYFEKENYQSLLQLGRLPIHNQEIAISSYYLKANQLQKTIGDTLNLYNEEYKKTYSFTIVGIIDEYKSQNYFKGSFSALSYIDLNDYYTVYIQDKDVSKNIFSHEEKLEKTLQKLTNTDVVKDFNSSYLAIQNIFEKNSHSAFLRIYNLIAIILLIIIFISVFIIYQAFNLSTNDRIQYLGMLSSVGATPKQKKRSVYFEGFILSLISIPLGIIVSFVGLSITFFFINQLEIIKTLDIPIHPQISLLYLFIVFIISLFTIFISLYLPARKISKISVIDALKKSDEIKVKSHKLKTGFLSHRFLSIYGQMALKNYKRQGRRSRVIVLSLMISMTSFISIYSFGKYMLKEINNHNDFNRFDIESNFAYQKDYYHELDQTLQQNDKVDSYYFTASLTAYANIDSSYLDIPVSSSQDFPITLVGLSENKRKELCKDNDLTYNQNQALVFNGYYVDQDGKEYSQRFQKIDNHFMKNFYIDDIEYNKNGGEINHKVKLKNFESLEFIKKSEFLDNLNIHNEMEILFIVPMEYIQQIDLKYTSIHIECRIFSTQHQELTNELENLNYSVYDYAQSVSENRQSFIIIQTFIYGFVCIMILFTMLNIINMMSASIDKRKRELGMMLSVGMSPKNIRKMLFYESFIYGLKTFIYGLPICIGVEWIFYKQMAGVDTSFVPSFVAYVIAFIVIMMVMLVTFRVGLMKFRKQNIIETLKEDM